MIDALINTLQHAVDVLVAIIGADRLKALFMGLLLSGGSTQFFKAMPRVRARADRALLTRTWAVVTAAGSVWLLYPAPPLERMLTALTAGFASPIMYSVLARLLDRWQRGAHQNLSGGPPQ